MKAVKEGRGRNCLISPPFQYMIKTVVFICRMFLYFSKCVISFDVHDNLKVRWLLPSLYKETKTWRTYVLRILVP